MEYIFVLVPIIISIVSLIFSIKAIKRQTPLIRIKLINPRVDAFYGATRIIENKSDEYLSYYVAAARFRLYNPSSLIVMIADIFLSYDGISYELANCNNEYWSEVIFYFADNGELKSDGSCIDYKETGISIPFLLGAYETKDIMCIFMDFQKSTIGTVKAKLHIDTAIGERTKKIRLHLYDKDYASFAWTDIEKYQKSL